MHALSTLKESYRERGLVLVVGAGMSQGSGLPGWPDILRRLSGRYLGKKGPEIYDRLVREDYTLPTIASILEARSGSREKFSDALREELYHGFSFYGEGVTKENQESFIKRTQRNTTLRAVASLCVRRDVKRQAYRPNPGIKAVVNFNFDALFQTFVRQRYGRILRTVERPSAGARPHRIPVYQMHGYFRFKQKYFRDLTKEAPDLRVFTEQEYFDFYSQPFSIYNYTFLHLIREFNCLFIGVSLKDDNMRRLLHYSRNERVASDRREGRDVEKAEARSARHFALLEKGRPTEHDTVPIDDEVELAHRRLGVNVIWLEKFKEIPTILKALYTSAGDDWQSVW